MKRKHPNTTPHFLISKLVAHNQPDYIAIILNTLILQNSFISISELTFSPLTSFSSNSPRLDSQDSTQTVNTTSYLNNSDIETPDEFSPTNFSRSPFQPISPSNPVEPLPSASSQIDATQFSLLCQERTRCNQRYHRRPT